MSELDPQPFKLVDMLAASAWWTGTDPGQRKRVTAEVEERRFSGGTVVMRKGETVGFWSWAKSNTAASAASIWLRCGAMEAQR